MQLYKMRVIPEKLDADRKWVSEYSANVHAVTVEVYNASKPGLLADIRKYPPARKGPMRWKSQIQRIAVMAKLRKEKNLPYKRSGDYARKWQFNLESRSGEDLMTLINVSSHSQFIGGVFTNKPSMTQQPFHQDTGWQISETVRKKWYGTMQTGIKSKVRVVIDETRVRFRKKRKDAF